MFGTVKDELDHLYKRNWTTNRNNLENSNKSALGIRKGNETRMEEIKKSKKRKTQMANRQYEWNERMGKLKTVRTKTILNE